MSALATPRARVKLCGVRCVEDALLCAAAGADEIGVVFARTSKRRVDLPEAARIRAALAPELPLVGVFLDATASEVSEVLLAVRLDAVQLHGRLDLALLSHPPARLGTRLHLVAAVRVEGPASLDALSTLGAFDRVLLDGPRGGGAGSSFDWALGRRARELFPRELFVAGGLTQDNVAAAIRAARPDGVDVASGIEGPDGSKDGALARAFVERARAAFASL